MSSNIKILRIERGLRQIDLQELSGVEQRRISRIERGEAKATIEELQAFGQALGVKEAQDAKTDTH